MRDSETVRLYLEDGIQSGRFAPGGRLPTERALADNLRVARSAVRDALAVLQREGIVVRRTGSGTYVSQSLPQQSESIWQSPVGAGPREIMEARFALEPRLARFAAVNAKSEDIRALEQAAEACDAATDFETYEVADGEFHRAIALATRNSLMLSLYETIERERHAMIWGTLRRRFLTPERRVESRKEHRVILDSLINRDPDAAEAAVHAHLKLIMSAMLAV